MKICIFGGTGLIGSYVCDLLLNDGHKITVATRNKANVKNVLVEAVELDLANVNWLENSDINFSDFDTIIYMAYSTNSTQVINRQITCLALHQLLSVINKSGATRPKKLIYIGSASVYGLNPGPGVITEESARVFDTNYSKNKNDAIDYLYKHSEGIRAIILHPTGVYSADSKRIKDYQYMLRHGYIPFIKNGGGFNNIIHAKDVAQAISCAVSQECSKGVDEYIVNGEVIEYRKWLAVLAKQSKNKNVITLPAVFKQLCRGKIKLLLNKLRIRYPLNIPSYKLMQYETKVIFSGDKAIEQIGFNPSVKFNDVF